MDKALMDLSNKVDLIMEKINKIDEDLQYFGHRLDRLEKVDSIEHRVTVNQIDLTDIKEIVEKVADFQKKGVMDISNHIDNFLNHSSIKEEINLIHRRLDLQLNKIAKNEEAILIVGSRN
ncbi:MAG: hypothetical protein Q8934_19800 [Bacillota bacterium]|nr:hypothetical protein [Bacillota bacterium]